MSPSKRPHSPSPCGSPPAKRRAPSPEEGELDSASPTSHPRQHATRSASPPARSDSWRPDGDSPVARRHRLPPRPHSPPPQTAFERERDTRPYDRAYDRPHGRAYDRPGANGTPSERPGDRPNGDRWHPNPRQNGRIPGRTRNPYVGAAEDGVHGGGGRTRPLDTPGAPLAEERVGIEVPGDREEGEEEDGAGAERENGREPHRDGGRDRDRGRERDRNDPRGWNWGRNRRPHGLPPNENAPPPIDPTLNAVVEDTIARIEREANEAEAKRKDQVKERPKVLRLTPDQEMQAYGRKFVGTSQLRDYAILEKLGEGTFGEVHKATHTVTRKVVALKRILMHNEKEGLPVTALREIKILKMLSHPSVVTVCDMVVEASTREKKGSIYMVFPYMDHDLAGLLENPSVKFSPSQIKLYMRQLLEGTEYLHRNKILHRDLKAANLLINNQGSLQIADFGLARPYSTTNPGWDPRQSEGPWVPLKGGPERGGGGARYTNCVVTRWYRPPELLMGDARYGCAIDMWGVGCIMGEVWTRRPILCGTSDADQLEKIWDLCGTPDDVLWPGWRDLPGMDGAKPEISRKLVSRVKQFFSTSTAMDEHGVDLVCKLLTLNPATRLTAFEALDHDYFWTEPLPCDPSSLPKYMSSHEYDKRKHKAEGHPPGPGPGYPPGPGGFNGPPMIPGPGGGFRPPGQWGPGPGYGGGSGPGYGGGSGPGYGGGSGPGYGGWDRGRGGRGGRGMMRGGGGGGRGGHYGPPPGFNPGPGPGSANALMNFSGYVRPVDERGAPVGAGLPPPLGTHSREHRQMRERNMNMRGSGAGGRGPPPKPPAGDSEFLPYG